MSISKIIVQIAVQFRVRDLKFSPDIRGGRATVTAKWLLGVMRVNLPCERVCERVDLPSVSGERELTYRE